MFQRCVVKVTDSERRCCVSCPWWRHTPGSGPCAGVQRSQRETLRCYWLRGRTPASQTCRKETLFRIIKNFYIIIANIITVFILRIKYTPKIAFLYEILLPFLPFFTYTEFSLTSISWDPGISETAGCSFPPEHWQTRPLLGHVSSHDPVKGVWSRLRGGVGSRLISWVNLHIWICFLTV